MIYSSLKNDYFVMAAFINSLGIVLISMPVSPVMIISFSGPSMDDVS